MLTCTATQCGCLHLFSVVCQSSNKNSRSYFAPSQGTPSRSGGQNVNFGQNQYYHPNQQNQQNQPTQCLGQSVQHSNFLQNCQNTPTGTALRRTNLAPTRGSIFFKCCDPGHYPNRCPKRNIQNIPDNQVQHWWIEVDPTTMLTPDFGTCQGGVLRRRKGSTLYDRWIWRGNRVPRSKILLTEGEGVDQIFLASVW